MTPEAVETYDGMRAAVTVLVAGGDDAQAQASEIVKGLPCGEFTAVALHTIHGLLDLAATALTSDGFAIEPEALWARYCHEVYAQLHG